MASDFDRPPGQGRRPRRRPRPRARARRRLSPILVAGPLALAAGLLAFVDTGVGLPVRRPVLPDSEAARFGRCGAGPRINCVVDGDTFWYRGEKIRLSDINAPEVGTPRCASEAALGEQATARLQALLNAGPFTLARRAEDPDRDRYGRLLREVTRGGESLGETLVAEHYAERWKGYRGSWC